jgi:hypothetical protein
MFYKGGLAPVASLSQDCQMVHLFSYQKSQFWYILENLGVEKFGIFYII